MLVPVLTKLLIFKIKDKTTVTRCSECIAPLHKMTRPLIEMSGQLHAPAILLSRKDISAHVEQETRCPQSQSGCFKAILLPLPGIRPRSLDHSARIVVTVPSYLAINID
jgi:hypothetical protein